LAFRCLDRQAPLLAGQEACPQGDQNVISKIHPDDILKKRVFQGDLQAINYGDNEWDYAMLNEVLEHVADDSKVLDEVYRILKPGGILFIFSPNRWFPFETHGVFLRIQNSEPCGYLLFLTSRQNVEGISFQAGREITGKVN
jgi:SAM-dependent methyltransferase